MSHQHLDSDQGSHSSELSVEKALPFPCFWVMRVLDSHAHVSNTHSFKTLSSSHTSPLNCVPSTHLSIFLVFLGTIFIVNHIKQLEWQKRDTGMGERISFDYSLLLFVAQNLKHIYTEERWEGEIEKGKVGKREAETETERETKQQQNLWLSLEVELSLRIMK